MSEKFTINFKTTSGHHVRVMMGYFWEELTDSDKLFGYKPKQFHAIRVYSTEDTLPRRLELRHEYLANKDYQPGIEADLKMWLVSIMNDKRHGDYDSVEDFLTDLADSFERLAAEAGDLIHHLADPSMECDPSLLGFEADDEPKEEEPER